MAKKNRPPRETVSNDDYFMSLAFWTATRSKDPHRQEGSVIISKTDKVIASEPNGVPGKIKDTDFSWDRVERTDYVERAVQNTLWEAACSDLSEARMYTTMWPTKRCIRALIRAGIKRVTWFPLRKKMGLPAEHTDKEIEAIKKIATLGGVTLEEFKGNLNWMRDQMDKFKQAGIFN